MFARTFSRIYVDLKGSITLLGTKVCNHTLKLLQKLAAHVFINRRHNTPNFIRRQTALLFSLTAGAIGSTVALVFLLDSLVASILRARGGNTWLLAVNMGISWGVLLPRTHDCNEKRQQLVSTMMLVLGESASK